MGNIKVGLTPANQSEEQEGRPLRRSYMSSRVTKTLQLYGNRPENLNDTITLEPCPAASAETSSHPPHPSSSTSTTMYNHYSSSWVSHLQIPWERFPLRLSHAITRGDRAHPEDRGSMVRIVVEAMHVHCRNPKRASCEEVAKIIVNRYPQTFADFTEKGERLGCGHYSLLRSIKSRVEHVNRDNTTHRLRQTKRTRNEEDYSPNSNATSPKKVRCLVDSYSCINWQPVELPEGETPASLEEKKHILLTIFNSQGPGAVERPDVDDFMCLTYISQQQLINSCPSLSVAEIQEQWPFLFTRKGLSNHFYKLTGIDISRRIINYFSSQKLKWNLGIRTLIQQIESEGVLTNNKVGTAAILLMMKQGSRETSTRMSLEAESNLPITPRLIMLGQSSMTATCWRVSAEGRVIVELDKENTFADAMSVFFGSFYVLNVEYQESACATLELIQRFFVRINPEEGTKCTSKVGTSRKTGTTVKRKMIHGPCFLDIYTRRTTMKTSSLAILQDAVSVQ
ncbi:metabotropic glutamate receptor 7 [Sarotherodon galilaeus]